MESRFPPQEAWLRGLLSNTLLLDGEARNEPDQINDHITRCVLSSDPALYTVDASEVCSWERRLGWLFVEVMGLEGFKTQGKTYINKGIKW